MSDRDTAVSALVILATLLLILAVAVIVGRMFGAAIGFASWLVLMAAWLLASAAAGRDER